MKHTYFYKTFPEELEQLKAEWMSDIREHAFGRAGRNLGGRNTIGEVWESEEGSRL